MRFKNRKQQAAVMMRLMGKVERNNRIAFKLQTINPKKAKEVLFENTKLAIQMQDVIDNKTKKGPVKTERAYTAAQVESMMDDIYSDDTLSNAREALEAAGFNADERDEIIENISEDENLGTVRDALENARIIKNPDKYDKLKERYKDDYQREGIYAAIDAIKNKDYAKATAEFKYIDSEPRERIVDAITAAEAKKLGYTRFKDAKRTKIK